MIALRPEIQEETNFSFDDLVEGLIEIAEGDTVLMMAQAIAWLLPWSYGIPDMVDAIPEALSVVYDSFPDYLPEIIAQYHHGDDFNLEQMLRNTLNTESVIGDYHDELEEDYDDEGWAHYMPYALFGVDLNYEDDARWDDFTDIVKACSGNTPDEPYKGEVIARVLIQSLESQQSHVYDNIAMLLRWLYAATGNSFTDMSYEEFHDGGWEPFYWDQFHYAQACQQEANDFFEQAMKGRDALSNDRLLHDCLIKNALKVRKFARKKGDKFNGNKLKLKLQWTAYSGDADEIRSTTQCHADLIRPWRVYSDEKHRVRG